MAGIYVHIPFCRSKCFYCGFYSVATIGLKMKYINALCREIDLRSDYLSEKKIETLYFGGGTPSYLEIGELSDVMQKLELKYDFITDAERTIELNPEDISAEKLIGLHDLCFNRLSIGVQSFNDDILKRINRGHSGEEAVEAIELASKQGFTNIGMDLIIGLPGQQIDDIKRDLDIVSSLPISHLSVYILSIDSNSVFDSLTKKGKLQPDDDDVLAEKYLLVSDYLKKIGFEHYEISNFARDGKFSRHNTSYWQQKEYIGFGPSAHSYNLNSRQWNISNISSYIKSLDNNVLNFEVENLKRSEKYNEYIMTTLRTMWGADLNILRGDYHEFWMQSVENLESYIQNGSVRITGGYVRLTEKGWLISDRIFSDLFV